MYYRYKRRRRPPGDRCLEAGRRFAWHMAWLPNRHPESVVWKFGAMRFPPSNATMMRTDMRTCGHADHGQPWTVDASNLMDRMANGRRATAAPAAAGGASRTY